MPLVDLDSPTELDFKEKYKEWRPNMSEPDRDIDSMLFSSDGKHLVSVFTMNGKFECQSLAGM